MEEREWRRLAECLDDSPVGLLEEIDWFAQRSPREWHEAIDVATDRALRATVSVVRIVLPEWEERQPDDSVPVRAIAAALEYTDIPNSNLERHVETLAKGCSRSRRRSLGYQHRIAEAARAVADAATATDDTRAIESLGEALFKVEEHLLYRHACKGEYGREVDVRRSMLHAYVQGLVNETEPHG